MPDPFKQVKIIELMELFDDDVVTTADQIDRPQQALDRETYDDFMKRNPRANGGRMDFQFGGGADAQKMGTEASRKYFKERKVDKPTPVFEGPAGGAKITDVKFASKAQEAEYIKILEDRFKFPKGSKEARKIASNADLAKKFGISLNNVERVNKALINKLNLSYPAQTYEGLEKIQRERDKVRKENIKKTSSGAVESKIKRDIKKVDATALAKDVDIAHRASLKANANLGAKYLTTSLGIDAKVVNQSIIKPIEQKLGTLYELQKKLIKDYKPGDKIPKNVQKQLEKINIKISELADRTNGVLQGVLVDEKTLKPKIYGIDYSKVLGFGLVDKPVSELTQADRDIIKLNVEEQIKTAKKVNPKDLSAFVKNLEKLGCGKAAGGRVFYSEGALGLTKCAKEGKKKLGNILTKGTTNRTEQLLATQILKAGPLLKDAVSLRALLGPQAMIFYAGTEGALIGYDMIAKVKSLREAVADSLLNLGLGPKLKQDPRKLFVERLQNLGVSDQDIGKGLMFDRMTEDVQTLNDLLQRKFVADQKVEQAEKFFPTVLDKRKKEADDIAMDIQDIYRTGDKNVLDALEFEEFQKPETLERFIETGAQKNVLERLAEADQLLDSQEGVRGFIKKIFQGERGKAKEREKIGEFFAGGGIAKLAGVDEGPPPKSGPMSQGLQGLMKRGMKI